jgi:methyl-accepting chemotaxis protein
LFEERKLKTRHRVETARTLSLGDVGRVMNAMSRTLQVINSNTRQVAAAASQTSNAISQISDGAQDQTHAIGKLATDVRETATARASPWRSCAWAANSAESTREISTLVQQAATEARRAVETVCEVSRDMEQIELGAHDAAGMMQRISAALEQQNAAVQEINTSLGNLNQIAESNAAASEEITATVMELFKIAEGIRREADKFTV